MKLFPLTRLLDKRLLGEGGRFTLGLCCFLVVVEVVGRWARSDWQDGLGLVAVCVAAGVVIWRHRHTPLPWMSRLLRVGQRWLDRWLEVRQEVGVDLRGHPPLPQRTPRAAMAAIAGLLLWGAGVGLAWRLFPAQGWRILGLYGSYTVYVVILGVVWLLLLLLIFAGVYAPAAMLNRLLRQRLSDPDRRGIELATVVAYAVLVSMVAWVVPPVWVLGLCLGLAAVSGLRYVALRGCGGPGVVWRHRQQLVALPVRRGVALVAAGLLLLLAVIVVTTCGGRLTASPPAEDALPLTGLLGAVAAWLMPGLILMAGLRWRLMRNEDPARRSPPTAYIQGKDRRGVAMAAARIRRWGWKVRLPPRPIQPGDVPIVVVPPEQSQARAPEPRWPLRLSVADLEDEEVRQRLHRRDEILLRRQLFHGLRKLFKRLAPYRGPAMGAFWLAPQWWFIEHVGREEMDGQGEDSRVNFVGPPYHALLPRRARQHAHALLTAAQVDLIFIEDGVRYKNVERVLRIIAELYDVHGGRRRAEDIHFRGLPKIKVMIHEYSPGQPFLHDIYPEPRYDDLSRLRVLHIFKDRGGEEERVEPPYDVSWSPAPALSR